MTSLYPGMFYIFKGDMMRFIMLNYLILQRNAKATF